jgi:hypothetical protein
MVLQQYIHAILTARPTSQMPADETDMHDEDLLAHAEALALAHHFPNHPCPKCRFPDYEKTRQAALDRYRKQLFCCTKCSSLIKLDEKHSDIPEADGRRLYEGFCANCGTSHHLTVSKAD